MTRERIASFPQDDRRRRSPDDREPRQGACPSPGFRIIMV